MRTTLHGPRGYCVVMDSDTTHDSAATAAESLAGRIVPFVPLTSQPLPHATTGALAELATWWHQRMSTKFLSASIDTSRGIDFSTGCESANIAIDSGANTLVLISSQNHCTPEVRAIIGLLTRKDAFSVHFQDLGMTDDSAMQSIVEIRDLMREHEEIRREPLALALLDPTVNYSLGVMLTASARKTAVITGNSAHLAAALIAHRVNMKAMNWWRHGATSVDGAVTHAIDRLGIPSGLDLGLTDHTGIGAQISAQILQNFIVD